MYAIDSPITTEKHGSQIEEAYWRLRQEIIDGSLKPTEKLGIDFLRQKYGFGASGIREALSRLVSDGLAESEPQRGFRVSPVNREELRDITASRQVIEVEALRQSIKYGTFEWEARVVAARYTLERFETSMVDDSPEVIMRWEQANRHFHMVLISDCPLRWLLRFTEQLYDQSQRYRHRTALRRSVPRQGLSNDHAELVEATLKHDAERACSILTHHIGNLAQIAEITIFGTETL
jgi:GntR family carbon starvation induced transcriptional regulator